MTSEMGILIKMLSKLMEERKKLWVFQVMQMRHTRKTKPTYFASPLTISKVQSCLYLHVNAITSRSSDLKSCPILNTISPSAARQPSSHPFSYVKPWNSSQNPNVVLLITESKTLSVVLNITPMNYDRGFSTEKSLSSSYLASGTATISAAKSCTMRSRSCCVVFGKILGRNKCVKLL